MPYESEKLKSRVFYYLCMVLAGCILANIVLRCDRNLQVFIPVSYTHLTLPTNREV